MKPADQGHVLFSSDLSLRVSYVARGRTDSPFITVPCFGNLHRVKGILILNSISLCGLFAGLHRPAGAALLTSDPWPANRNKVNISWAAAVEGGPENKFDPTSPEGDEWFPFQAGDPLALLFTALLLKSGGCIECLSTVYQQKGKDQVTAQSGSSFFPNQSLCPQYLRPHGFIFCIQAIRA